MRSAEATGLRTHRIGSLSEELVGKRVALAGWVHRCRDLGKLLFVDLRDASGLAQLSFGPDWTPAEALRRARTLGPEYVARVEGLVCERPDANPDLATGGVELRVDEIEVLSVARTPEIPVYRAPEEDPPSEELRLRHRPLDLRRTRAQQVLAMRHDLGLAARNHLDSLGFVEVETPILTKATPEGARDYVVPSRVHPGEFYALPQSPQLYKQILMTAGVDRYFQIARCFRDEDLRADRQPEFTQIDLEAAFAEVDDILRWTEGLASRLAEVAEIEARTPFPRLTWAEAMERYGSDKPDLRNPLVIEDHSTALARSAMGLVRGAIQRGDRARGIVLKGGAKLSRRLIGSLEDEARNTGAPGLLWAKWGEDGGSGPLGKHLVAEEGRAMNLASGDLILVAVGRDSVTSPALAAVRDAAAKVARVPAEREHSWAWVTDFPLFEDKEGRPAPSHHPFVMPHPDDVELVDSDPFGVRGTAYDLVYNGTELGSGSVRVHLPGLQRRILSAIGLSSPEIDERFGFLLHALGSGAPPHAGIALGLDRAVQKFTGSRSLRDVIAFPKTTQARSLFEGAPTPVPPSELETLGIVVASRRA